MLKKILSFILTFLLLQIQAITGALFSPLTAIPDFRTENREHVEALIAHTAKFLGQEKFSARIAGALIKRSAEVGLKVGGVVSESGLEARDIIDQPLQEVHIDKHNVVALPLLDTIALCGASSEFVILKRQAFNAMRSKGMTTQEAMKKLNEPKTKQALEKVAQYVSDKVAEAEKQEFANTQLYVDALEDEVEPTLLDSLLQGASVDLSSVAPEQLPLLEDVIAERFCDQSEHTDLMLHILTTELPDDVREIAQDYVTERVEMQATGSVRILTRVGQALKTVGQITAVGAAHLLDPIPGAPIGKGVEVLTGVSTPHEAYKDIGKDAAVDAGVMTTMGAVPFIPGVGAVVGKVMQNMGKAWNAGKRVLLKNSSLLRKVETRLAERTSKTGSSGPERIREAVNRNLKLHKNDLRYKGKTHVYQIVDTESGEIWKIGESARGVDKLGQSIRAQEQVRNLGRMYNKRFKSEILQIFDGKAAARAHETNLIKVLREKGQSLPGNKGVH